MPKVSIAVPAYNCERDFAQSLESLLGQTSGDFELIISDNASTDGTEAICRRYEALDQRVRYVRRTQTSAVPRTSDTCSRFAAVGTTSGGLDDNWHPAFLAEAVAVLDDKPNVVLCYPKTRKIDMSGNAIADYDDRLHLIDDSPRVRFRQLYERVGLCNAHLGLIRRESMLTTRLIAGHRASDVDFLAEMALRGKFWLLPDIRFFRRFHVDSSSWAREDSEHQRGTFCPTRCQRPTPACTPGEDFLFQLGLVWRSPAGMADKIALSSDVARWARHSRHELSQELVGRLRQRTSRG